MIPGVVVRWVVVGTQALGTLFRTELSAQQALLRDSRLGASDKQVYQVVGVSLEDIQAAQRKIVEAPDLYRSWETVKAPGLAARYRSAQAELRMLGRGSSVAALRQRRALIQWLEGV